MTERQMLWESLKDTWHLVKGMGKLLGCVALIGIVALIELVIWVVLSIVDLGRDACLREVRYTGRVAWWFDTLFSKHIWRRIMAIEIN